MRLASMPGESMRLAGLTARGLAYRWTHAFTGAILTWVISNGVEASAHALPWPAVSDAFSGAGVSWKAAIIQAAIHATWNGIVYVNRQTGRDSSSPLDL